jgi:hypothetical protein
MIWWQHVVGIGNEINRCSVFAGRGSANACLIVLWGQVCPVFCCCVSGQVVVGPIQNGLTQTLVAARPIIPTATWPDMHYINVLRPKVVIMDWALFNSPPSDARYYEAHLCARALPSRFFKCIYLLFFLIFKNLCLTSKFANI